MASPSNESPNTTVSHPPPLPTHPSSFNQQASTADVSSILASDPVDDLNTSTATATNQNDSAPTSQTNKPNPTSIEETTSLANLAEVRDQSDLELTIARQADALLLSQADERDQKRLEKTEKDKARLLGQIRRVEQRLAGFGNAATKNKLREEREGYVKDVEGFERDVEQIRRRMEERRAGKVEGEGAEGVGENGGVEEEAGNKRLPGESQREFLIRTGKITPFSKLGRQLLRTSSSLGDVLLDAEEEEEEEGGEEDGEKDTVDETDGKVGALMSHRNLLAPGFEQDDSAATSVAGDTDGDAELARRLQEEEFENERPAKRRRLQSRRQARAGSEEEEEEGRTSGGESDVYVPGREEEGGIEDDGVDDVGSEGELPLATTPGIWQKRKGKSKISRAVEDADAEHEDLAGIDDGNEQVYQARVQSWAKRRRAARRKFNDRHADDMEVDGDDDENIDRGETEDQREEWHMPHPNRTDTEFEGGLRIPGDIYPSLFDYQKTGVQWLWELYSQQVGGIIGDEMGLGKTIQVISFLAGLHYTDKLTKPVIVVCPATVMKQWVNEFHRWWPPLRVSILHTSGSGMLDVKREARIEDDLEEMTYQRRSTQSKGHKAAKRIVDKVIRDGHVLVTTYSGLQTYAELLIPMDWEYAVLDEGHKIRNPNTAITIYCKELRTHNRVILSGTPMQNNLTELWSLFDFVFPMRLGTLVTFRNQFEIPIKQGGYANASNLQVETAMKCAETLKDTISPYLLQRFKVDVAADLPKKSERVLFCKLTKLQRDAYEWFLASEEMKSILAGKRQALYGVDILRKICNHPDLVEHKTLSKKVGYNYGNGAKSGKMQVVKALLEIWKRNGHKTLLFAQHRIMLDILETFVGGMEGFKFRRMDGNTSIKDRQDLVDEFNRDPGIHVFLLTTKVGGLGVNLTGADRVIIYDPDWNPSTDVQARERAWRLGQKREVEIYRLMTAGTIEEKIYHRQIFKQFLTNKILRDPKQRQTFQLRDLHDLFTLGEMGEGGQTETSSIFQGTEVELSGSAKERGQVKGKGKGREVESLPTPPDEGEGNEREVERIVGVSRQEHYRGQEDEDGSGEKDGGGEGQSTKDDRMLSSLFARSGVHSAVEHDAIINGRKTVRADPEIIAREARKVARLAAEELQRAGDIARTVPAGVPTWTGQVGTAGRPDDIVTPPRRGMSASRGGRGRGGGGGPSSVSVLANLQARQIGTASSPASSSRSNTPATAASSSRRDRERSEQQLKGKDFLVAIRDFLLAQGGKAYTQMLIDHFNRYCKTEQRTAEFKEMLKTIATLEKGGGGRGGGGGGRGRWVLREEYTPQSG